METIKRDIDAVKSRLCKMYSFKFCIILLYNGVTIDACQKRFYCFFSQFWEPHFICFEWDIDVNEPDRKSHSTPRNVECFRWYVSESLHVYLIHICMPSLLEFAENSCHVPDCENNFQGYFCLMWLIEGDLCHTYLHCEKLLILHVYECESLRDDVISFVREYTRWFMSNVSSVCGLTEWFMACRKCEGLQGDLCRMCPQCEGLQSYLCLMCVRVYWVSHVSCVW